MYQNPLEKSTNKSTNNQPTNNQQITNNQPQYNKYNKYNKDNNNNNNIYDANAEKVQKIIIETIGSTNLTVIQECISYLDDFPIEVIEIALKKTAEVNGKWKYTKTILNNWLKNGINTIEKVQADDLKYKSKKNGILEETEEEKNARKLKELEEALKNDTK